MRVILFPIGLFLIASPVLAQTPTPASSTQSQSTPAATEQPGTTPGHEVNVSIGHYNYVEPGTFSISIHGPKFAGEYTGTAFIGSSRRLFTQINARGSTGSTTYDGWCSPYLIKPNSGSPNGYELGFGDPSPCSETGDKDWYFETRGVVGKDWGRGGLAWSPYAGVGYRHLANGISGINNFRTDEYLYVPIGMTAHVRLASRRGIALNVEVDPLIRGWQKTRDSAFGSGDIPATPIAPAFTINGFSDVAFGQHSGWAFRASAKYQAEKRWSIEPYFVRWNVADSPAENQIATFTVNGVSAQQLVGFFEPKNFTNEFGVKFGLRLGR